MERGHDVAEAELVDLKAQAGEAGTLALPQGAIWRFVSGQSRVGPMTLSDLRAEMAAGKISAEGLVWREGMVDWARGQRCRTGAVGQAGL